MFALFHIFYFINYTRIHSLYIEYQTYLCLRKWRLKARKASANVTPTLAMQVIARNAAGATVTIRNLRAITNSITRPAALELDELSNDVIERACKLIQHVIIPQCYNCYRYCCTMPYTNSLQTVIICSRIIVKRVSKLAKYLTVVMIRNTLQV